MLFFFLVKFTHSTIQNAESPKTLTPSFLGNPKFFFSSNSNALNRNAILFLNPFSLNSPPYLQFPTLSSRVCDQKKCLCRRCSVYTLQRNAFANGRLATLLSRSLNLFQCFAFSTSLLGPWCVTSIQIHRWFLLIWVFHYNFAI